MRLINNYPILILSNLFLSPYIFGLAKSLLSYGEKLKFAEQRLNFLRRCKYTNIFPAFINNSIHCNSDLLFNAKPTIRAQRLVHNLKSHALNYAISGHYHQISQLKQSVISSRNELYHACPDNIFNRINTLFAEYNEHSKRVAKERLRRKYDHQAWLQGSKPPSAPASPTFLVTSPPVEEERNTAILETLSDNERALLDLGPNFALSTRVDKHLTESIGREIAACAYRLRWKQATSERATVSTRLQVWRSEGAPTARRNLYPPPPADTSTEDKIMGLQQFVANLLTTTHVPYNLTNEQALGLRSLKGRKKSLHISISDKGGEFVVSPQTLQQQLTQHHLDTSVGVYKCVSPRKSSGKLVVKPTATTYRNQVSNMTATLEDKFNKVWTDVVELRSMGEEMEDAFHVSNTRLPCLYILIKTHKFKVSSISSPEDFLSTCKVRPIVSCVGSPSSKMAWLVTLILSPLLDLVPCHLNNIHKHLDTLRSIPPSDLTGLSFCTADISALYTNLDILACIKSVIEFAEQNIEYLNLRGLQLVDVHTILDEVLLNSYFTYDGRLYKQLQGLFMGCAPSPIAAVIRVFMFERSTLYADVHFLPIYGRYIDDAYTLAASRSEAVELFNNIGRQDPDGLITWEVDFPEMEGDWTPFLGTEVRVVNNKIESQFYRKPTRKRITLHFKSHHPLRMKIQTARNFYHTAELSSSPAQVEHSREIVDNLLLANGYTDPRSFASNTRVSNHQQRNETAGETVVLKLPYLTEGFSDQVTRFVISNKLPIKIVFTPGKKLREIFCSSRPRDGLSKCKKKNCKYCPSLKLTNGHCQMIAPVYKVECVLCGEIYVGETGRTAKARLAEHLRYARSPTAKSYKAKALAIHYSTFHPNTSPNLSFSILATETKMLYRKIIEATFIHRLNPTINLKEEMKDLTRFLVI